MSDVKVYVVDTKGKKSLNVPSGAPLYNGQMVRFSEVVVNNTSWIKHSIAAGNLVEIKESVSKEVRAPKVEKPEVEVVAKKSGKKTPAKAKEVVKEESSTPEEVKVVKEVEEEETLSDIKDENVE